MSQAIFLGLIRKELDGEPIPNPSSLAHDGSRLLQLYNKALTSTFFFPAAASSVAVLLSLVLLRPVVRNIQKRLYKPHRTDLLLAIRYRSDLLFPSSYNSENWRHDSEEHPNGYAYDNLEDDEEIEMSIYPRTSVDGERGQKKAQHEEESWTLLPFTATSIMKERRRRHRGAEQYIRLFYDPFRVGSNGI